MPKNLTSVDTLSTHKHQKMIHVSLITCDTACIYLVKNKKAQGKVKKEQTLIQSDLFMHLGIYSLQKLLYSHNQN